MTKIKICGLSRRQDINYVNEALPDFIGFVFAASKRHVTPEQAKVLKSLLDKRIKAVGVFADAPEEEVLTAVQSNVIDIVQLHGSESPEYAHNIKKRGCTVIKAVSMQAEDVGHLLRIWEQTDVDYLLLDGGNGGTGQSFDYSLIGKRSKPFFLAGGITPENIAGAAREVKPFAVDLSSGAETHGVKDRIKILNAVRRLRENE